MPNRAHSRRDPQKGKNGFSKLKGFTLIELLVAIGVLAIITSLALPSYRTIIEKRQVTSGAEQLAAFMSAAQMDAVKHSQNLTVTYDRTDSDTWCIGTTLGTTACDCGVTDPATADCVIDDQVRIISGSNLNYPGIMADMDGDGSFVFDPARGLIHDDSSLSDYDEAELVLLSDDNNYSLKVQITATGRVKICSDGGDKKVPGYQTCARDIGDGS